MTTGYPVVAARIFELLGGDAPQPWDTKSEETLEVFTAVKSVAIIIENAEHLRQRMQLWSRKNKLLIDSDGELYNDGTPDPDADLTFVERKKMAETGFGPKPAIDLVFRLAEAPELGLFKFATGAWSVAYHLAANDVAGQLEDVDDPATATLTLERGLLRHQERAEPRPERALCEGCRHQHQGRGAGCSQQIRDARLSETQPTALPSPLPSASNARSPAAFATGLLGWCTPSDLNREPTD